MQDSTALRQQIQTALGRNVTLLWTGRPSRGIVFRATDAFLIPFSALWLAVPASISFQAVRNGTPLTALFPLVLFLAVGLYALVGRFAVDAYRRSNTAYGVSESDAYIVRGGPFGNVISYNLRTAQLQMTARGDGSGTISFAPKLNFNGWGSDMWIGSGRDFERIPKVGEVYGLITELASGRGSKASA